VTDEHRMPYRRPPLTKELLRGESTEAELPIEPEQWLTDAGVALVSGRAVRLDAGARAVSLTGGRELSYGRCVLSTGAEPTRLPIAGSDDPGVRVIRSLDHVRELLSRLDGASSAVAVIGSGFIGCEIASSLRSRGHRVSLISDEPAPNARRLGDEAAEIIGGWLLGDGVELHLAAEVERIERSNGTLAVHAGELRVSAEVVVMAAGVAPRSELASCAGIELDGGAIPARRRARRR